MKKKKKAGKDKGVSGAAASLPAWARQEEGGAVLLVHAVPRASRTEVIGEHNGRLKIKVQAPPVEGAANKGIRQFLSKRLGVSRNAVKLVSGDKSREKIFFIKGITPEEVVGILS